MTGRRVPIRSAGTPNGVGKDIPSLATRSRRDRTAGVTAFADAWASALAGTSYVRLTGAEVDARLRSLTVRLGAVINDDPFDPAPAAAIGADLVATDFTAPEALGRTIGLISQRLLTDLEPDVITPRYENPIRLAALLDKFSTGFTRALRARTLDEQEEIRQAALAASAHMRQELLYSALHDPLTGLANRALMMDHLAKLVLTAAPDARLGLCVIGLDTFRDVTESLGHEVGDKVLKVVAERLDHVIGDAGHLIAHIGGHRFAFLVEGTTCADDVVKVADEALSALDAPFRVDAHELPIAACAGIVERLAPGSEPAELMRAADMTLHWARTDNRGRLAVFDAERNAHEVARYRLSAAMPAALDRGEFILEYQPLVRLSDGTLRGVEALARWRHPELGLLPPDRFIELAEDTGLIVPLGLRLLEEACRQTVEWHEHTADPPFVSVNLAARQLHTPSLVADVAAILDSTKLRPRFLQLEITESDIIGTDEHTLSILRALGNLGIRLAIDDFGTGYANIACLPDLPVNSIKLAGNFVARLSPEVERDDTAESILGMLIKLGHMLKMSVTAEGIETPSQERRLTAIGCDLGQGWRFGRPGTAGQISELLIARPSR